MGLDTTQQAVEQTPRTSFSHRRRQRQHTKAIGLETTQWAEHTISMYGVGNEATGGAHKQRAVSQPVAVRSLRQAPPQLQQRRQQISRTSFRHRRRQRQHTKAMGLETTQRAEYTKAMGLETKQRAEHTSSERWCKQ